ncbi:uncharacterized protein LOC123965430 [Micropterus dolomieu]|uniref:uncharacterized protein LOC123965430 n=1 Tax=Micropterus dolomieu TaxID=147949 RepID=UPI001E8E080B|nr:uncharacterized protein LOC123965430 [Micropterus dolomieu]
MVPPPVQTELVNQSPTDMVPPPVQTELVNQSPTDMVPPPLQAELVYESHTDMVPPPVQAELVHQSPTDMVPPPLQTELVYESPTDMVPPPLQTELVHESHTDMVPPPLQTELVHESPTDMVPPPLQTELVHESPTDMVPPPLQTELVYESQTDMVPPPLQAELVHESQTDMVPPPVQTELVYESPTDMVPPPVQTEVRGRSRTEKHDVETQHPAGRGSERITEKISTAREKIAAIFSRAQAKIAAFFAAVQEKFAICFSRIREIMAAVCSAFKAKTAQSTGENIPNWKEMQLLLFILPPERQCQFFPGSDGELLLVPRKPEQKILLLFPLSKRQLWVDLSTPETELWLRYPKPRPVFSLFFPQSDQSTTVTFGDEEDDAPTEDVLIFFPNSKQAVLVELSPATGIFEHFIGKPMKEATAPAREISTVQGSALSEAAATIAAVFANVQGKIADALHGAAISRPRQRMASVLSRAKEKIQGFFGWICFLFSGPALHMQLF